MQIPNLWGENHSKVEEMGLFLCLPAQDLHKIDLREPQICEELLKNGPVPQSPAVILER